VIELSKKISDDAHLRLYTYKVKAEHLTWIHL